MSVCYTQRKRDSKTMFTQLWWVSAGAAVVIVLVVVLVELNLVGEVVVHVYVCLLLECVLCAAEGKRRKGKESK